MEAGGDVCTGQEDLRDVETDYGDVSELRPEYNVYKAVYALAHALHDLLQCVPGRGPFSGHRCASLQRLEPWQVGHTHTNRCRRTLCQLFTSVSCFLSQGPLTSYCLLSTNLLLFPLFPPSLHLPPLTSWSITWRGLTSPQGLAIAFLSITKETPWPSMTS